MHDDPMMSEQAHKFYVCPKIHSEDHIFNFLTTHPGFPTRQSAVEYYFNDGSGSCRKLASLMSIYLKLDRAPDVLEFASGYGMVSRHLKKQSGINLWSCDIHQGAVAFLKDEIGVRALLSSSFPETLSLPQSFDVIFVLSLFSHLPITTWCRWLVRLTQALRPNGIIIFTTHGRLSIKTMGDPTVSELGFWFLPVSEQKDLPGDDYGSTITTEAFVRKNIQSIPGVELVEWKEGFWWGHQDVYVVRKKNDHVRSPAVTG